jgi:benzoyl-CoA reductase/2-hydroxyglutaryl-CoA dehydratase subunit BcrC/BadD/HgdB
MNEQRKNESVRLMLLGNAYWDVSLLDLIESSGGSIVFDDTSAIGRDFAFAVKVDGDPLASLARHYARKVTGCYRLTYEERWEHIFRLIGKWRIDGCIHVVQKYCDTSLFELPLLRQSLNDVGIRSLVLEIDDTSPALGSTETRVQAFLEMFGDT